MGQAGLRHRRSQQKSLSLMAAKSDQALQVIEVFHPFGDGLEAHCAHHADNAAQQGGGARVTSNVLRQQLVELDRVTLDMAKQLQ